MPIDKEDHLTEAINSEHPIVTDSNWECYDEAVRLVSNRHSKYALVDLVNYLLVENKKLKEKEQCN